VGRVAAVGGRSEVAATAGVITAGVPTAGPQAAGPQTASRKRRENRASLAFIFYSYQVGRLEGSQVVGKSWHVGRFTGYILPEPAL
jgi:hypothetical protein